MKSTQKLFQLTTVFEEFNYNYKLNYETTFNLSALNSIKYCDKISLNFGFKDLKFEKKHMILYFFLLELMSNQKCVLTTSKKNLILFKIKKGSITGCKVTLQKKNLHAFLENLCLSLPRSEVFKGFTFKKNSIKYHSFSTKIKNLFIFYTLESELTNLVKYIDISFSFNTVADKEKTFFFTYHKIPLKFV